MRKSFNNSPALILAILGVYFLAFKVLMPVRVTRDVDYDWIRKGTATYAERANFRFPAYARHEPRWGSSNDSLQRAMEIFFAPLIWMERSSRGGRDREWDGLGPEPDWVKEYPHRPL